jgi:two-component system cell cycle response regulator DivK
MIKIGKKGYKMIKEIVKPKILIIEDDEQSRYMLTFLFESNNCDVIQSFDGTDGIAKAKNFKSDVILLDIQLPGMNGYDVIKTLKMNDDTKNIPIVVITALTMNGDRNRVFEAGADEYIAKPIDPETFIPQIESFIPSFRS